MKKSVIVLIGTTGAGKSTVGNLLVNPEKARLVSEDENNPLTKDEAEKLETFVSGYSTEACTQGVKSAFVLNENIEVVDTPGFDESIEADTQHTVNLLKKLQELKNINAVVLCQSGKCELNFVKFLKYARTLLTDRVLNKNLIILYTKCKTGDYYMQRYPPHRRNDDMKEVQKKVKDTLGSNYVSPVFPIDSCPPKNSNKQWETTLTQRSNILDTIRKLTPIDVSTLKFPKQPDQLRKDQLECAKLESSLCKLQEDIKRTSNDKDTNMEYVAGLKKRISRLNIKISACQADINTYDTDVLEVTGRNTGYQSFNMVSNLVINVVSTHPMASGERGYNVDLVDKCDKYDVTSRSPKEISITVKASTSFLGRAGATVTCYSEMRVVFADTIKVLKKQIEEYLEDRDEKESSISLLTKQFTEQSKETLAKLEKEIKKITERQAYLSRTYFEIGEQEEIMKNEAKNRKK